MALRIDVQIDPRLTAFANGIENAVVVEAETFAMTARTAKKVANIARNQIDRTVYSMPQSDVTSYERTQHLRKAVKVDGVGMTGHKVFIDPAVAHSPDRGFYYPVSVEYGLRSKPSYYPRRFWQYTEAIAKVIYFNEEGPLALHNITMALKNTPERERFM